MSEPETATHERPPVVLVTGASRGIGRAIADRLAADGMAVVVGYRQDVAAAEQTVEDIVSAGGLATAVCADVASHEGIERLAEAAVAWRGQLNHLVNNAGMMRVTPPDRLTEREFRRIVEINLMAPFGMIWQLKDELARHSGSIVNLGSLAGVIPAGDRIPYSVSKAGLDMLTRTCAMAFAPQVRVNCVAPSSVQTPAMLALPPEYLQSLADKAPMHRLALPSEVAAAVSFLLSVEASYITGHTLYVSGGQGH